MPLPLNVTTSSKEAPLIAVIIPYFQREAGILRRAITSIARQDSTVRTHVIVIDDASPTPANTELKDIDLPDHLSYEVMARPNGGPAAARNTGLDQVPESCRYIAFLDSDDEWSTDHITNAWKALESGYDFYFANHYQLGQTVGAFERAGRIDPQAHPGIKGSDVLHAYQGNLTDQILTGNVIGTSTVVFRRSIAPQLRFREEYRNAGEDYIYWLELARLTDRICFSECSEATYGKGVNVYSGVAWGTEEHMSRVRNELRFKLFVQRTFTLSAPVQQHVELSIINLRREYCLDLLHLLKAKRRLPWSELKQHWQVDRGTLTNLPAVLFAALRKRH